MSQAFKYSYKQTVGMSDYYQRISCNTLWYNTQKKKKRK